MTCHAGQDDPEDLKHLSQQHAAWSVGHTDDALTSLCEAVDNISNDGGQLSGSYVAPFYSAEP